MNEHMLLLEKAQDDLKVAYLLGREEMKSRIIEFIKNNQWHPGGATGSVNPDRIIEAIKVLK
jgi:hypothetical protein